MKQVEHTLNEKRILRGTSFPFIVELVYSFKVRYSNHRTVVESSQSTNAVCHLAGDTNWPDAVTALESADDKLLNSRTVRRKRWQSIETAYDFWLKIDRIL